ncbi:MAG: hypothetical protein AB8B99_11505 [Phormidesmis sp.]
MLESLLSVFLSLETKFNPENFIDTAAKIGHNNIVLDSINSQHSGTANLLAQEIPAIQKEGFVFEFLGCESTPNTDVPLTCDFLVENSRDDERLLYLYAVPTSAFSRVIDVRGNEIIATNVELGSASNTRWVSVEMPSRIPLRASLSFSKAPEGGIRILDVGAYNPDSSYFDVEFRFSR